MAALLNLLRIKSEGGDPGVSRAAIENEDAYDEGGGTDQRELEVGWDGKDLSLVDGRFQGTGQECLGVLLFQITCGLHHSKILSHKRNVKEKCTNYSKPVDEIT
jgi:hypothetical protein